MIIQYRRYDLNSTQTKQLEAHFYASNLNHQKILVAHKFRTEEKTEKRGRFSVQLEWELNEDQPDKHQAEAYRKLIDFIEPLSPNRQADEEPKLIYQEK